MQYSGGCLGSSMPGWDDYPRLSGDYQTAMLLQISITEKSPSDQLWEPEAKQRMSPLLHQAKVSEPRQMDSQTLVRENFVPAPCC